ncbi:polysaccharide pyruvyl transferase family protein [Halomonas sp. NPDC076908]|uniref:polysaccharide pyruvyl transferase family protein n=1 Tax=Halomonas sp. NPDC076908 TaxID=3390567 RepID=UPI003D01732F
MDLFWWQSNDGMYNLGDEITRPIFEELFDCHVSRSSYPAADVISTGSILGWAFERDDLKARKKKMVVMGSGFMHPWVPVEKREWLDIKLVRGYLTKNLLSRVFPDDILVGDPGLLVSYLDVGDVEKKYKYGVIPHISSFDKIVSGDEFSFLGDVLYIDFRTDDYRSVLRKMKQCEFIISQGLHGLIFSDSMGIPNVWLDQGRLHSGGEFKFFDYFSSINRSFDKKVGRYLSRQGVDNNLFCADREAVGVCKENIYVAMKDYFKSCEG